MAIADIDPADARLVAQSRSAAAKKAPLAVEDSADVIAAKKLAADVAAATGQTVDPNTGQIVVDPAAIAAKFPEQSGNSIPAMNNRSQEPRPPQKGYKWQWVSMSKTNNPYGGEWREIWAGGVADDNTGDGGNKDTNLKSDAQIAADTLAAEKKAERQSAYDLLYEEFSKYGLSSLVEPLKGLIVSGVSPAEFTIKLRETPDYQKRFAGNAQRIAKGLTALDEATYLAKEDAYQNLMRNYGLPDTYWKKDAIGTQEGFTKLIANDVSAVELENRLQTAQQRVVNANPEVAYALRNFYPDITNGDILAYALDPKNALDAINRKVTAAEIGGAALSQGLTTTLGGAEGLAAYGITKAQAEQGYQTVAGVLPRASQLADIYGQQPYNQQTAEAEVFGTQGASEAKKRRERLVSLEQATFGGSSGVGALGRDKAIYGGASGQSGLY